MVASKIETILDAANVEWGVEEPPGRDWHRITHYIREGLGWGWEKKYTRNRQFAWCGAFASHAYRLAGLAGDIRLKHLPSTYRLNKWSRGTKRRVEPEDLQPGDIGVVGHKKRYGDHVVLVERTEPGFVYTIEGNAHGLNPEGERVEGVVKNKRPIEEFRFGVRPLPEDYEF